MDGEKVFDERTGPRAVDPGPANDDDGDEGEAALLVVVGMAVR